MGEYIEVKVNGENRDIKMTFGMLNTLCQIVGDVDNIASLHVDAYVRSKILTELLSDRDSRGKVRATADLESTDVSMDDVEALLTWAGDHVLDFFLKALERTKALQDKHLPRIKALMPSQPGSGS